MLDPTPDPNEWKFDVFCIICMCIFLVLILYFSLIK